MLNKSKISGKKWAANLIYNILKAKHNLWLISRKIVHDKAHGGLYMEENREIDRLVVEELNKGSLGMSPSDFPLMNTTLSKLKTKPVDYVRGWLVDVYLARGEYHNAEKELQTIRTGPNYKRKERSNQDLEEGGIKRKRQKQEYHWKSLQQFSKAKSKRRRL